MYKEEGKTQVREKMKLVPIWVLNLEGVSPVYPMDGGQRPHLFLLCNLFSRDACISMMLFISKTAGLEHHTFPLLLLMLNNNCESTAQGMA